MDEVCLVCHAAHAAQTCTPNRGNQAGGKQPMLAIQRKFWVQIFDHRIVGQQGNDHHRWIGWQQVAFDTTIFTPLYSATS